MSAPVRTPRRCVIGLLAGMLSLSAIGVAEAQQRSNLNRAQEGRVAVAQCYTRCLEMEYEQIFDEARLALDGLARRWNATTFSLVACSLAQTNAIASEMCRAGCTDIEIAYSVRSSHIRTRYHWFLNRQLREARASGLWSAWNRFPELGTNEFARACSRYLDSDKSLRSNFERTMESIEPESEAALKARLEAVREEEYEPPLPDPTDFEFQED